MRVLLEENLSETACDKSIGYEEFIDIAEHEENNEVVTKESDISTKYENIVKDEHIGIEDEGTSITDNCTKWLYFTRLYYYKSLYLHLETHYTLCSSFDCLLYIFEQ